MNAMDIFILTSHWGEGFPNVLAEAMIMKLICISTEVGDVKKIIGNHGFILPSSYNIEDLQIAINNSICIMNHEETKERARNWILENFSEDTMISNYKNEYNKLFLI